jgi:hypothetical protein
MILGGASLDGIQSGEAPRSRPLVPAPVVADGKEGDGRGDAGDDDEWPQEGRPLPLARRPGGLLEVDRAHGVSDAGARELRSPEGV